MNRRFKKLFIALAIGVAWLTLCAVLAQSLPVYAVHPSSSLELKTPDTPDGQISDKVRVSLPGTRVPMQAEPDPTTGGTSGGDCDDMPPPPPDCSS